MGIEVEAKLVHVSAETGNEQNNLLKENGKVSHAPITFGSHGIEETKKDEGSKVHVTSGPKDAAEDWPEPMQIHSFHFVRYRRFEDPKLKPKLEQAEKELQKKNQARTQIIEKLKSKRAERAQVIEQRKKLSAENKVFWSAIDDKRKEMEPLQEALGQLRGARNAGRERGSMVCSSEEELNDLIKSLQYRIQHESIPLNEEKQILREIKQLEGTREDVRKNAVTMAKIQESLGEKESIQNQVKLISGDLNGVRKEQQVVKAKLKQIDDQIDGITKQINLLEEELKDIVEKRDKTFEHIQELRKQREEGNAPFYQNSELLRNTKELADKKDVEALKVLSVKEVDKFMSLWCGSKSFRDDYEKRILQSLDIRQLSRDGRMRNPDEKPLVSPEAHAVSRTEVPGKPNAKPVKEDHANPSVVDTSPIQKVEEEESSKQPKDALGKKKSNTVEGVIDDEEEIYGLEKLPKNVNSMGNEIDEATLRKMKREEEIEKNRQAMERKKKLAEKAAAKAAMKAQKEAEKKLKERERKARKKAGTSVMGQESTDEQTETPEEVAEEEKVEGKAGTPAAPKFKERKDNTVRHRPVRARGSELPKAILKRKKATNYWLWAIAPAALVLLVLLVVGYKYLQK